MQDKENKSKSQLSAQAIRNQISDLREELDILGKSKDDRPNYIKALYPNKIDAIRSKIWEAINQLNFKLLILEGTVRTALHTPTQTLKNYAQ